MADKATAPLDLLREIRTGFEAEARHYRELERQAPIREQQANGAKAYAAEQAVRKIDATLRDWA
jgi:hypothetical protein